MKRKPEWRLRAVGAALAGAAAFLCLFPVGQDLVHTSFGLPFIFRSHLRTDDLVLVYLDASSFENLKASTDERLDRRLHAQLLERLVAEQAKAVVYDILFLDEWPEPAVDARFARAMKAHGKVILASSYEATGQPGAAAGKQLLRPTPVLREAAAAYGAIQVAPDAELTVRRHLEQGAEIQSLAWAAATVLGAKITRDPEDQLEERWINYYGPPESIPSVSFDRALSTNYISAGFFRDKIVFIGSKSMPGLPGDDRDEFATPYTRWTGKFAPGVEIQATMFLNLWRGDWLRRMPEWADVALLFCLGAALGYGLTWLKPWPALGTAFGVAVGATALAWLLVWSTRLWFSWYLLVAIQVPLAVFWAVLFNYFQAYVQQRLLEQSLMFHLPPARVREILARPDLLKPGAEKRPISILFSDIADFSTIAGRMVPQELVQLLNDYFEETLPCIYESDGTVVKLIGDAIFAIWNAPIAQADHHERACRAALLLRGKLIEFDSRQVKAQPLRTRVGLHSGDAAVGNFGSRKRFDFTAMGESVNLASRLEGLNKYLGTDILITAALHWEVKEKFVCRLLGNFRLKGLDQVVEVYELIGTTEGETTTDPWRTEFESGIYHYRRRDFDSAEKAFHRTLELRPKDGPSRFYLDQVADLRLHPPEAKWKGEVELKEK